MNSIEYESKAGRKTENIRQISSINNSVTAYMFQLVMSHNSLISIKWIV